MKSKVEQILRNLETMRQVPITACTPRSFAGFLVECTDQELKAIQDYLLIVTRPALEKRFVSFMRKNKKGWRNPFVKQSVHPEPDYVAHAYGIKVIFNMN